MRHKREDWKDIYNLLIRIPPTLFSLRLLIDFYNYRVKDMKLNKISEQVLNIYEYCPTGMHVQHMHAWNPYRPVEGSGSCRTGVINDCVPSCVYWELISCPLNKQKVPLLCSPGQPRICYVAKAGQEFIEICSPLTPECWDSRCVHHARIWGNIFKGLTHVSLFFFEWLDSHGYIACHTD